jgi:hexosaminidase
MSEQAQFWADSWDTITSTARKPIWGNSYEIYKTPKPAQDQTLPLPAAPTSDLEYHAQWSAENVKRTTLASESMRDNENLIGLINENIPRARFNRYNLEVYLTIAELYRQNLAMINGIRQMDRALAAASNVKASDPKRATAEVDKALDIAKLIWRDRNEVLKNSETTWYKSWFPRVSAANSRRFLHELDDVKDHLPDRTVDLSYLVYREKLLPFGEWVSAIRSARNQFAAAHHLPPVDQSFNWSESRTDN